MPGMLMGGSLGRLVGVVVYNVFGGYADPGQCALVGAAAFLAGSGRIRITLTLVMLETTSTLNLIVYVATAAICATLVGDLLTHEGLYHAQMEAAGIPYLPSKVSRAQSLISVNNAMSPDCITMRDNITKGDVLQMKERGDLRSHHGFPVVSADKKLVGLLSLSELQHPDHPDSELVNKIMDSAPFKVVEHWPLVRAYQLFTCLGLRHLVVVSKQDEPVGVITRWNLQPWYLHSVIKQGDQRLSGIEVEDHIETDIDTSVGQFSVVGEDDADSPLESSTFLLNQFCTMFSLQSDREIFQYTHATFSTPSRLGRRSTAGDSTEPAEDSPGSDVFLTLPRNSTASAFDIARNSSTVTPTRLSLSNGDINDILDDHLDDKVDENPASDSQPVENSDPKSQSKSNK